MRPERFTASVDPGAQIIRRLGDHPRALLRPCSIRGAMFPTNVSLRCRSSRLCFGNILLPYSKLYGVNYLRPAKGIFGGKPLATAGVVLYMGLAFNEQRCVSASREGQAAACCLASI
jgi:hypothetical protein